MELINLYVACTVIIPADLYDTIPLRFLFMLHPQCCWRTHHTNKASAAATQLDFLLCHILFSTFTSIHVVVLSHCWMVMFSLQHSFIPACFWLQDHDNSQIWTLFTVQHRAIVVKSWPNVFSQFFPHWSLFNLDSPKIAVCAWHGTRHVCVFYLLQGSSYMLERISKI